MMIAIRCAIGFSWERYEIEFRPIKRGFSVWLFDEFSGSKWLKQGGGSTPLTWRTACAYLASGPHVNLIDLDQEDFRVTIEGVPEWAQPIVYSHFVENSGSEWNSHAIGQLLSGFSDKEVNEVLTKTKTIAAGQMKGRPSGYLATMLDFSESVRDLGMLGSTLAQLKKTLGLRGKSSIKTLAARAKQKLAEHYAKQLLSESAQHKACTPAVSDGMNQQSAASPSSSTHDLWASMSRGPVPNDLSLRAALVECWLTESVKPVSDRPDSGGPAPGMGYRSEWHILRWLLDGEILEWLSNERPNQATAIVAEVMRRGKAEAYYFEGPDRFSGWASSVIGSIFKRWNVTFSLSIQADADKLKIPIDDKYRIGGLSYWTCQ